LLTAAQARKVQAEAEALELQNAKLRRELGMDA
jgi:hypothetical protein